MREMYHLLRKAGLYEGSAAKCCKKDIRQIEPYITIKNMDMISATAFISPIPIKINEIQIVTSVAFNGSLFLEPPFARMLFMELVINILSAANAFRVLGATIIDPKAEEIVAAASPIGIIGHQIAI
jgi:hypothetical protein